MSASTRDALLETLRKQIGTELHVSDWVVVTQERIDAFAAATGDHQWIHVDAERASRESPYGTTIAHGYLTLSLYPYLRGLVNPEKPVFPGVKTVINYGLNKLRFPNAVRAGAHIRGRSELVDVQPAKEALQVTELFTAEIEGETRPGCVAEVIMRLYL